MLSVLKYSFYYYNLYYQYLFITSHFLSCDKTLCFKSLPPLHSNSLNLQIPPEMCLVRWMQMDDVFLRVLHYLFFLNRSYFLYMT